MASVVIAGDVSGTCTLQAANAAGTTVLTLPTTSGTLVSTTTPLNASSITSGTLAVSYGGTGANTLTGVLKGNGTSAFTAAVAGTDFVSPGGALGTPSSGTLTNCTGYSASNITTGTLPAARLPAGSVLQVVTVNDTTQYTYSNGSANQTTYQNISGMVASITPASSSNKILLIANITASQAGNSYNAFFRATRNGTVIGVGNSSGYNGTGSTAMRTSDGGEIGTALIMYLDSPATTSSVSYQIQICNSGGSSAYSFVNRPANSNTGWEQTGASSIILMEIAG
jgi:hypothetical protein